MRRAAGSGDRTGSRQRVGEADRETLSQPAARHRVMHGANTETETLIINLRVRNTKPLLAPAPRECPLRRRSRGGAPQGCPGGTAAQADKAAQEHQQGRSEALEPLFEPFHQAKVL